MALRVYEAWTLRGNRAQRGIRLKNGRIPFTPSSGMARHTGRIFPVGVLSDGSPLRLVQVGRLPEGGLIVRAVDGGEPSGELVLAEEYTPGCGAKRGPRIYIQWGEAEQVLVSLETAGGSGCERWSLALVPIGWAEDIAEQFENERDAPAQTISYGGGKP